MISNVQTSRSGRLLKDADKKWHKGNWIPCVKVMDRKNERIAVIESHKARMKTTDRTKISWF
ncbi:hypothetical protein KIN20_024843 [Parelaphostrongylus tenuis]|uniref:Uncharacterized protein n=1 Tax=Parelaphostrongylus tenuis TaxID=148309 RepID=A0AAD5NBG4_PARTN|nr:hypothetical protein KIN20_024843 [Parelaphostrongylus tenuis]